MAQALAVTTNAGEITMERTFAAPRALVFEAFTTAEHLKNWWGPLSYTMPVCEVDFRPGGTWLYCFRGPNGEEAWAKSVYKEIVAPERIVFTSSLTDAEGNPIPGLPVSVDTIELTEANGQTKLVHRAAYDTTADREQMEAMMMVEGLTESWNRLESYLGK